MSRSFSPPVFDSVALLAGLTVPEERAELVRGTLESVYGLIDQLDALHLDETPPATAFDARWE
jgi:Asp-tRNA(Asn)/Glu-tRNA(Gln) amidotransferase C subunit